MFVDFQPNKKEHPRLAHAYSIKLEDLWQHQAKPVEPAKDQLEVLLIISTYGKHSPLSLVLWLPSPTQKHMRPGDKMDSHERTQDRECSSPLPGPRVSSPSRRDQAAGEDQHRGSWPSWVGKNTPPQVPSPGSILCHEPNNLFTCLERQGSLALRISFRSLN